MPERWRAGRPVCPQALSEMDEFKNLDSDIEGSAKRWKKLVESEAPEKEVFPKEWKNKTALQKLCVVRCMRPDRMTYAVRWAPAARPAGTPPPPGPAGTAPSQPGQLT